MRPIPSYYSTELFNKAYNHISERIDEVYKDLTKGKAAPMGGVAYLSLEDNEVRQISNAAPRMHASHFLFFP
jgi:chromosome segregation ATPase